MNKLSLDDVYQRVAALPEHEQAAAVEAISARLGQRKTLAATKLEREGWRLWVETLFPTYAHAEFAFFHEDFWQWCWAVEAGQSARPYVAIWYRGAAKSTSMQLGAVSMGARRSRRYAWYISEHQDQADRHLLTIGNLLAKSSVERYYPDLGQRKVNKFGSSEGWRRNRYRTADGFTIDALGLDTAARGGKLEEQRPDLMIFDDIDGKHDSPSVTQKKIEIITASLLPAGSPDLAVMFGQNLITRDSIASRLVDGRAEFLANARVSGPHPALRGAEFEVRPTGRGHVITRGTPLWQGFDLQACQDALDREGLEAFRRERQNDVDIAVPGTLFPEWDEAYHVITDAEFTAYYQAQGFKVVRAATGRVIMPERFVIGRAQDVGTTVAHPNVTGWVARPSQVHPLNDCVFAHRELVFPDWQGRAEAVEPVSLLRIATRIYELETAHKERDRIQSSLISHEASSEKNTYSMDLPKHLQLHFSKWSGDRRKLEGVSQIQNFLTIDKTKEHPFRRYPAGYKLNGEDVGGQYLMGRPRLMMVVADGQGEFYMDTEGRLAVKPATNSDGMLRARWEMPKYRLPLNASGEESSLPIKIDDDYIDQLKAQAVQFFPRPGALTAQEIAEQKLPPNIQRANIEQLPPEEVGRAFTVRQMLIGEREAEERAADKHSRFKPSTIRFQPPRFKR